MRFFKLAKCEVEQEIAELSRYLPKEVQQVVADYDPI